MPLALPILNVSASEIATYETCAAQYFHGTRGYHAGLLRTDRVAADVSSAVHNALMQLHRQFEQELRSQRVPGRPAGRARLRMLVDQQLRFKRLDRRQADVAARLAQVDAGLDRVADLVGDDLPTWARDARSGDALVWVEGRLDHGPMVKAIELEPTALVRTLPDVIGLRVVEGGPLRVVVRDYKAKSQIVDPIFDSGILLRGIWALLEIELPRCRWFLAGRGLTVDATQVDLETVNLMHASGDEFLLRATLPVERLLEERDRFVATMQEMGALRESGSADEVLASPSGLCAQWCPFLGYCEPGQAHVRKYVGEETLLERLSVS